jgi:hypothetical protein
LICGRLECYFRISRDRKPLGSLYPEKRSDPASIGAVSLSGLSGSLIPSWSDRIRGAKGGAGPHYFVATSTYCVA